MSSCRAASIARAIASSSATVWAAAISRITLTFIGFPVETAWLMMGFEELQGFVVRGAVKGSGFRDQGSGKES
jgi:hypothetical protein